MAPPPHLELFEAQLVGVPDEDLEAALEFLEGQPSALVDLTPFSREDPRDFFWEVLGCRPTEAAKAHGIEKPWTEDLEDLMVSVRDNKRTVVYSGNSTGKTWTVARLCLWFLLRHPKSRVVTTAPNLRQVQDLLWGEIRDAFRTAPVELPGRLLETKLVVGDKWEAIGFTAKIRAADTSASGFQGVHGPFVLVVIDEGPGVDAQIIEAAERCAVGAFDRIVVVGNPTDPTCKYAKLQEYRHADGRPLWHKIVIDSSKHPNVVFDDPAIVPGAATRDFIEGRLAETGSEDSGLYRSSVLGLFPTEAKDALIPLSWIDRAQRRSDQRDEDMAAGKFEGERRGIALGLDVADEGGDLTVCFAIEEGRLFLPHIGDVMAPDGKPLGPFAWHRGRDVLQAVAIIEAVCKKYPNVRSLALDDTGLGKGVSAQLRQLQRDKKLPLFTNMKNDNISQHQILVIPTVMGGGAILKDRFVYRKDELWWTLREALRERKDLCLPTTREMGEWNLPRGHDLIAQISTPIYDNAKGGRISVFDKRGAHNNVEKTRNLPALSPDLAHAAMLAWDAYRRLSSQERVLPRTNLEALNDRLRSIVKGKVRKGTQNLPPWMQRG